MSNTLSSAPANSTSSAPSTPPPKPRRNPRPILIGGGIVILFVIALVVFANRGKESTDDAFIEGHVMQISPQVAGPVLRVLVEDNQRVKAGDLLVELDPRENKAIYDQAKANADSAVAKLGQAQAQLASAQAAYQEAQSDIEEARANSDNATKEFNRGQELRERGVTSEQDLDRVNATARSSKAILDSKTKRALATASDVKVNAAAVEAAKAQVELANALFDTAKLRLSYTQIFAPQDGRITRKNVEIGNYVQTGAALMAVVSDDVWVVANFKETQLHHMRPGQPVDIRVDAYPSLRVHGRVDSIQAGTGARFSLLPSENATGNYVKVVQRIPAKITLLDWPKDGPLLAPGMSVTPTVDVH
jgi:membrane fusion protein, multidrug efflux system